MLVTMELIALRLNGLNDLKIGAGTYSKLVENITALSLSPMEPKLRMSLSSQSNPVGLARGEWPPAAVDLSAQTLELP